MITDEELSRAEQRVHAAIGEIRRTLDYIEQTMQAGLPLNERGELQQKGPLLDTAIARLCTLREVRAEYDKGRAESDDLDFAKLSDEAVLAAWIAQDDTPLSISGPRGAGRRDALLRTRATQIIRALSAPPDDRADRRS